MRVDKAIELVGKYSLEFIDSTINLDLNKRIATAYTEYTEDKLVDVTTQVLQEWIFLSKADPQAIIDEGRNLIAQNTNLTTLLAHWEKINKPAYSTKSQMEALSAYYELASLLTFPVSVMIPKGNRKNKYEKEEIFKHFKVFGLTGALKDKFRIIRNANSHAIELSKEGGYIIHDNVTISFQEIFEIYRIVAKIFRWYFKLIKAISIGYPKIGLLFIYGFYYEIKTDKDHYKSYFKDLRKIAPYFLSKYSERSTSSVKEIPKKDKGFMFSIKSFFVKLFLRKEVDRMLSQYAKLILFIFSHFFERLKIIVDQIKIESAEFVNIEHMNDFEMIAAWLNKKQEDMEQELVTVFKSILK